MRIRGFGVLVFAVLVVDAVLALWLLGWQVRLHGLLSDGAAADAVAGPEEWVGDLLVWVRGFYFPAVAFFLLWLRDVRDGTEKQLPGRREAGGRSWRMWWWIVPVANIWMGFRITADLWAANTRRSGGIGAWLPVAVWWVLTLAGVTQLIGHAQEFTSHSPDDTLTADLLRNGIAATAWYLAALAATAVLVVRLTRAHASAGPLGEEPQAPGAAHSH
ncbi:hypothetical protein SRB5_16260 [Streptomyces sp. RB5]|uniref:DUF4328 domain-containing protein n=1 Tax=Streptomyces smaragdinus TaxID=2585196 RepID=A0A7K0CDH1_9ACTN|nr:DUF4328 domain-containing protein [Streptomyces smaragdinus]MQY11507.1 hypothetical protein [Streptomyces smaragdinus]